MVFFTGWCSVSSHDKDDCLDVSEVFLSTNQINLFLFVAGGNRNHLKPSNVTIEDNFVTDTSRLSFTGQPAVMVEGVGMTVRHNELANVGSFALWWTVSKLL